MIILSNWWIADDNSWSISGGRPEYVNVGDDFLTPTLVGDTFDGEGDEDETNLIAIHTSP